MHPPWAGLSLEEMRRTFRLTASQTVNAYIVEFGGSRICSFGDAGAYAQTNGGQSEFRHAQISDSHFRLEKIGRTPILSSASSETVSAVRPVRPAAGSLEKLLRF